ncbi:MAG: hypothetical protein ACLP36_12805 [Acidimicrobiales bacterium]
MRGTGLTSSWLSGYFSKALIGRLWVIGGFVALSAVSVVGGMKLLGTPSSNAAAVTTNTTTSTTTTTTTMTPGPASGKGSAAAGPSGKGSQNESIGISGGGSSGNDSGTGTGGGSSNSGSGEGNITGTLGGGKGSGTGGNATGTPVSQTSPSSVPETGFILLLPITAGAMLSGVVLRRRLRRTTGQATEGP